MKIALFISLSIFVISTQAQVDIRKIDFKNFTYNISCSPNDKMSTIKVRDGEFRGDKNGIDTFINITDIKFGDINSDRIDEAVIKYGCGSGASGYYTRGLLFAIKNKKPIVLALIEGGDKGFGGIKEMRIEGELLVVERYELPTVGSPCCPAFIETTKYRFRSKKLVRVGKVISRKIRPSS
jgi:hypothetical protein